MAELEPSSLTSEACREELAYALCRALHEKGERFPLIGMINGVRFEVVPPALRVRGAVNLASPTWREEVKAALEHRPPNIRNAPQSPYVWQVHHGYGGDPQLTAVEVRPRFGGVAYWRFVVPTDASVKHWGHGPAGGGAIWETSVAHGEGFTGELNGTAIKGFGAGDQLSPSTSAYGGFKGQLPAFVGFGLASGPAGPPGRVG